MTRLPLLLGALGACTDPTSSTPTGGATKPYVRIFDSSPYALRSVGVDSATYRDLIAAGAGGAQLVDLGPGATAARTIRLRVDGGAPAALYTALLGPDTAARAGGDMAILLGDDTTARIGLLVPAVQKVRGAALEADGTFELELSTPADIAPSSEPVAAGGVWVASGDINGDASGGAAAPIGGSVQLRLASRATFTGATTGLASGPIELAEPDSLPAWFDPTQLRLASLDLRDATGRVAHRIRIDPPTMASSGPGSITLAPAKGYYLKIDNIDGEARDGAAEAALVDASYATYSGRTYLVADDRLAQFAALTPPGGVMKLADLKTYWQDRTLIVADLAAAAIHASDYEALACQVALPDMLSAAQAIDTHAADLGDVSGVLATAFEAVRTIVAPSAGAHSGTLTLAGSSGATLGADATRACDAVEAVASVRDALQVSVGTPNAAADRVLRVATIKPHARDLDRALAQWVAMVDALAASTTLDPSAASAAHTKADILIDALGQAADASSARWALAVEIAK